MNTWKLNNTLLNNQSIKEEIKGEIQKFLETWKWKYNIPEHVDTAKAIIRGKLITINTYIKELATKQPNDALRNQKMTKLSPKLAEEIKIGAEINAKEQKNNRKY